MEGKDSVPDNNNNHEMNEVSVDGVMQELKKEENVADQNSTNNRSGIRVSRPRLSKNSLTIMKRWLYNHRYHAYPTNEDKEEMSVSTGLTVAQVTHWFVNARRRLLPNMLQFEGRNPNHFLIKRHSSVSSITTRGPNPITDSPTVNMGPGLNGQMGNKERESDQRLVNNLIVEDWMRSLELAIIRDMGGSEARNRPAGKETPKETASGKSKQAKK